MPQSSYLGYPYAGILPRGTFSPPHASFKYTWLYAPSCYMLVVMKIPLPHQTNVRLDDETFERLMSWVSQYKLTKSDVIREALIRDLDRRDLEKAPRIDRIERPGKGCDCFAPFSEGGFCDISHVIVADFEVRSHEYTVWFAQFEHIHHVLIPS